MLKVFNNNSQYFLTKHKIEYLYFSNNLVDPYIRIELSNNRFIKIQPALTVDKAQTLIVEDLRNILQSIYSFLESKETSLMLQIDKNLIINSGK